MKQLCDILGAETVDSIPYRLNEVLFTAIPTGILFTGLYVICMRMI